MTPYKFWIGRKPSLDYFKILGFLAHILISSHQRGKLDAKTIINTFI